MTRSQTPDRFIAAAFRQILNEYGIEKAWLADGVLSDIASLAAELAREGAGDGELLRCPFCASNEVDVQVGCHMTVDAKVVCSTCGAEGPVFGTNAKTGDFTDQAITAWNTRASEVGASRSVGGDVERDAARYRWLRDKGDAAYIEWGGEAAGSAHGSELDTAIDAALAGVSEGKEKP